MRGVSFVLVLFFNKIIHISPMYLRRKKNKIKTSSILKGWNTVICKAGPSKFSSLFISEVECKELCALHNNVNIFSTSICFTGAYYGPNMGWCHRLEGTPLCGFPKDKKFSDICRAASVVV